MTVSYEAGGIMVEEMPESILDKWSRLDMPTEGAKCPRDWRQQIRNFLDGLVQQLPTSPIEYKAKIEDRGAVWFGDKISWVMRVEVFISKIELGKDFRMLSDVLSMHSDSC